jgi:CubicO group peptidase (beta-lactamase class C family)
MPHPIGFALASVLAALPLAATSSPLHAQPAGPGSARLAARIDSIVQAEVLARGVSSVQIVITRGDEVLLDRAWGIADAAAQRPADAATTYRLGSMAKQFTAALVLRLVDGGRLSLNDSIGRYLAGLKPEWNGLTIEQLLNHTSGVPRDYRQMSRAAEPLPVDSLIAMAARSQAPTAPAGTTFIYSNTGYMLLGALVEKLHGKSYREVLRDEIARPLGLASLGWCGDTEAGKGAAKGYYRAPDGTTGTAPYIHPSQMLGSGGICSNAGDVARWNRALHGGRVLSAASYAAMITPHGVAASRSVPYGLGVYVRETPGGGTVIVHDGLTPGYVAENVWYPAEFLSVTMLTNTTTPALGADSNLTEAIGRIVLGRPEPAAQPSGQR